MKLLNLFSAEGVEVRDPSLRGYITLKPMLAPHSGGRHGNQQFKQVEMNIVERLIDKLMTTGHEGRVHRRTSGRNVGKKQLTTRIVTEAFEAIEKRTKANPIQVLINAIENTGPREDTTRVKYGGIAYHISVDISPKRRVDIALRFITIGAAKRAFGTKTTIRNALAEEIIAAANKDTKCYSVSKKEEQERVAKSAR